MKGGFVNVRGGLYEKREQVENFVGELKLDFFGVGESNLAEREEVKIKGFNWVGRGTVERIGGVGIYVRKGLIYRKIKKKREGWIGIKIKTEMGWIRVLCCYLWQDGKVALDARAENGRILGEMGRR